MMDIAGQVLEVVYRESGKLLMSLFSFWMKTFTGREKGD